MIRDRDYWRALVDVALNSKVTQAMELVNYNVLQYLSGQENTSAVGLRTTRSTPPAGETVH